MGKHALIIGNSEYQEPKLAQLVKPGQDARGLADVLLEKEIGGFDDVKLLVNEPEGIVSRAISRFFAQRNRNDLLLLYFSGHGVLDDEGQLYFAVRDTEHDALTSTAIAAGFVRQEMNRSLSRRQVLILDCCNSGSFGKGTKGVGESVGMAATFDVTGYGRAVLTATDAIQYAWENNEFVGSAEYSVFTHFLIDGLKTGAADNRGDADGQTSLDELFNYARAQVRSVNARQTPTLSIDRLTEPILLARNPRLVVKAIPLADELRQAMENTSGYIREGAVRELEHLLNGSLPGLALSAREALIKLKEDDSRRVSALATEVLAKYEAQQTAHEAEQLAARQIEEERLAHERAEKERVAHEIAEQQRLRREKAEAERLAAEKARQEKLAQEKAEAERLAVKKADEERAEQERLAQEKAKAQTKPLAVKKAEVERLAREAQQAEAERKAKEESARLAAEKTKPETGPVHIKKVSLWSSILLTALSWGIGLGIFFLMVFIVSSIAELDVALTVAGFTGGAIGGLGTALTLRRAYQSIQIGELLIMSLSWAIALAIGTYVLSNLDASGNDPVALGIGWGVTGLLGAIATNRVIGIKLPLTRQQGIVMTVGWGVGWLSPAIGAAISLILIGSGIGSLPGFVIAGAFGGGIMFWQLNRKVQ